MAMHVPSPPARTDRRTTKRPPAQRVQIHRFENWQRSTPHSIAALVRIVRLLAR
jgi:hypothetical protein